MLYFRHLQGEHWQRCQAETFTSVGGLLFACRGANDDGLIKFTVSCSSYWQRPFTCPLSQKSRRRPCLFCKADRTSQLDIAAAVSHTISKNTSAPGFSMSVKIYPSSWTPGFHEKPWQTSCKKSYFLSPYTFMLFSVIYISR